MSANGARYICVPPNRKQRIYLPLAGLGILLATWLYVTDQGIVNQGSLPGPVATGTALIGLFHDAPPKVPVGDSSTFLGSLSFSEESAPGEFRELSDNTWDIFTHSTLVRDGGASIRRILKAVFWACLFGLPMGILMGAFGTVEGLFGAIIPPMRNAPTMAFLPLFYKIYGVDEAMKVNFLAFGTIVYIIPMTFDAVRNVPSMFIDKAVDLGFRRFGTLRHYVIPAALPRIYDGIRICTGVAWTYLVAAEVINVTTGLGASIQGAIRFNNMPKVYAGIITILIMGVLTDTVFRIVRRLFPMLQLEEKD